MLFLLNIILYYAFDLIHINFFVFLVDSIILNIEYLFNTSTHAVFPAPKSPSFIYVESMYPHIPAPVSLLLSC